jgi:hypothetical protein
MSTSKTPPPEENNGLSRDRRSHGEDYPGAPDDESSESRYAAPPAAPDQRDADAAKPKPRQDRGEGRGDETAALRFGPEPDDE